MRTPTWRRSSTAIRVTSESGSSSFASSCSTSPLARRRSVASRSPLKWGQPAYLTRAPRSGTTIRIAPARGGPDRYALYVHCQSKLIPTIKRLYASTFRYEKNRALVFETGKPVPLKALSHCIELALTYHLDEKAAKRLDPSPQ